MVKFTDKKFMDERWRCLSFNEVKKFDFKVPRKKVYAQTYLCNTMLFPC